MSVMSGLSEVLVKKTEMKKTDCLVSLIIGLAVQLRTEIKLRN